MTDVLCSITCDPPNFSQTEHDGDVLLYLEGVDTEKRVQVPGLKMAKDNRVSVLDLIEEPNINIGWSRPSWSRNPQTILKIR